MNLILGIILLGCSAFIGFNIGNSYKRSLHFLQDFLNFINFTKNNIKFLQSSTKELIECKKNTYHQDFNNFLINLQPNFEEVRVYIENFDKKLINDEIKVFFIKYFEELGRLDVQAQIKSIEQIELGLESYLMDAKEKNKKFGATYKKLGLMCGVALCIIVL